MTSKRHNLTCPLLYFLFSVPEPAGILLPAALQHQLDSIDHVTDLLELDADLPDVADQGGLCRFAGGVFSSSSPK